MFTQPGSVSVSTCVVFPVLRSAKYRCSAVCRRGIVSKLKRLPIRQPFSAHDVFKWFVVYLDPGGAVVDQFGYSQPHTGIRATCSCVTLSNHTR
jgi:hypothetical protein